MVLSEIPARRHTLVYEKAQKIGYTKRYALY